MKETSKHIKDWKLADNIKTGFTIPENYFTDIEDDFSSKLIEDKLPKHNGFQITKAYFENVENNIIEKTIHKKGKLINFKTRKIKLISVAASIALLLFFGSNFIYNTNTELSSEEIISWLDMNVNSFSNDDIPITLTELNFNDTNPYDIINSEVILESLLNSNDEDFIVENIETY
ncbi:hypothetical protein N9290_02615 [Flavobacteriaceae bacterium]|nr:hypothetical protein [Flavobacteriaceae bacterium]MDB4497240.1 hypothetical protein [Flavobacteriaceae bacterium]MDB4560017.1 hypothetical protein [Flavobacteriaceae bacterium]